MSAWWFVPGILLGLACLARAVWLFTHPSPAPRRTRATVDGLTFNVTNYSDGGQAIGQQINHRR